MQEVRAYLKIIDYPENILDVSCKNNGKLSNFLFGFTKQNIRILNKFYNSMFKKFK